MDTVTTTDTSGANFKIAVAIDTNTALILGAVIFVSMFVALLGALVIYKKL